MSNRISRRAFLSTGAATSAALAISTHSASQGSRAAPAVANPAPGNWVRWLDQAPAIPQGVTWGTPWPRGKLKSAKNLALRAVTGAALPLQSWPLAYWPDGSLKWTAHAMAPGAGTGDGPFEVVAQRTTAKGQAALSVTETAEAFEIDTGVMKCRVNRRGAEIIGSVSRDGREALRAGKLVLLRQDRAAGSDATVVTQESFESVIEKVTLEQRGPVRAVLKIEGKHANAAGRTWLPFTLRLYFYAGGEALRVLHTIVFDGDESKDFIRGVGLRFSVPANAQLYDRHVRFIGADGGVFGEAVRGLTGLRRDAGPAARKAQVEGEAVASLSPAVSNLQQYIPAFGDWTLFQPNADAFTIRKRTDDGHAWLDSARGTRASGLGYVGGPTGGIAFGIRNF